MSATVMKIGAVDYRPVSKKFLKANFNPESYSDITFSKSELELEDSTVSIEHPDQEILKSPNVYVYARNVSIETHVTQEEEAGMSIGTLKIVVSKLRGKVLEHFQTQEYSTLPGAKTQLGTVVVWLDPIQLEIMKDPTKRQVIVGPASTGKTLLIQLKVLEIMETTNDNVLIILPYQQLVEKYKEFLKNATDIGTSERVKFVTTESEDWEGLLEENKTSHWFVDEFATIDANQRELSDQILTKSR
jgi:hypothetical protein